MSKEKKAKWNRILTHFSDKFSVDKTTKILQEDFQRISILKELNQVGWKSVFNLDENLEFVILKVNDDPEMNLKLNIPKNYPKSALEAHGLHAKTIQDIFDQYKSKVEKLIPIKKAFAELESKTRVIESGNVNIWNHRRIIAYAPGICFEVSLDPEEPYEPPQILILGPDRRIQNLLNALATNLHLYDPDLDLGTNLEQILEITLPKPQDENSIEETFEVDCGICYVYQLGDSIPTEICDNSKCSQPFHKECLTEHLQTSHQATRSHKTVFGKCPFCDSDISCQL